MNALLVAFGNPLVDASKVYATPDLSMLRLLNSATPLTASTVVVPLNTPPLGFEAMATVIDAVDVVTVLPKASLTSTCGLPVDVIGDPAVASAG